MAKTYKLKIAVENHANVYVQWGETDARIRIYRSTTGLEVDRVLYDTISMAPHVGKNEWTYEYDDTDGDEGYAAWFTFYDVGGGEESGFSPDMLEYGTVIDNHYISITELRNEGLLVTVVDDVQAARLIKRASRLIDKLTRNFFFSQSGTFEFDGNNSHILHLPVPIISVTSLKINNETVALETDYYKVYNGRSVPNDNRDNPKIELRHTAATSIYSGGLSTGKFYKGWTQTIEGFFGYLESDDTVPEGIKQACMILVMTWVQGYYAKYGDTAGLGGSVGSLKSEATDDHKKEWHNPSFSSEKSYTKNSSVPNEVYDLIKEFHAPRGISVTAVRWGETY